MARRRMGRGVGPKRPLKLRVPRKIAARVKPAGVLESYPVICSGCSEEFALKPKENGAELSCPFCDHTAEPPGKAFLDQLSRYALRERDLVLRTVIPVVAAFVIALMWMNTMSGRSSIPRTGLSASIAADSVEIPVASTEGFPSSGTLIIGPSVHEGERIAYGGVSGNAFTDAEREATGASVPGAHRIGEPVYSKSYRTTTIVYNVLYAIVIIGLLGYGVTKGFAYEKSRWKAFF